MTEMAVNITWLNADWNAPSWVRAGTSTRQGGKSRPPYDSLNLAHHVGDSVDSVKFNREILKKQLELPSEPVWLDQVHGNRIIHADTDIETTADAIYTENSKLVCVIMTADCIPLFLCDRAGSKIAAIHVGWRGYCAGIISRVIEVLNVNNKELLAWIGPHISQKHYEVGKEVYQGCVGRYPATSRFFSHSRPGHWHLSLESLVRYELGQNGVGGIVSSGQCTYENKGAYYSYRRDKITGRMASMIWLAKN